MIVLHVQALLSQPWRYATGAYWRLWGKRVRARGILEPLLGRPPLAYRIWCRRSEPRAAPGDLKTLPDGRHFQIVVEHQPGRALDQTVRSLRSAGWKQRIFVRSEASDPLYAGIADIDWIERCDHADLNPDGGRFWLAVLRSGDLVAPTFLQAYAGATAETASAIVYADDDAIDARGRRYSPHFKPRFNAELFKHHDFLTYSCAARVDGSHLALAAAQGPGWWQYIVHALAGVAVPAPHHLTGVMHHRRDRPEPVVPPFTLSDDQPAVTIIVPTRDKLDYLEKCLSGVNATAYSNMSVIVIDNGSVEARTLRFLEQWENASSCHAVMRDTGPFNYSRLNNAAAAHANSGLICFLNNDIEIVDPAWLAILAEQAKRADVGAVGAQLLYPDGSLQHAGVVIGVGGGAAHAHRGLRPNETGYFRRHAIPQFVSAVTAACMVVDRERFLAVGGFDERAFPVAFNDVDLCLKLNAKGWQSLYEPRATLIHHESKSRGKDSSRKNRDRFASELAALKTKWQTEGAVDPYHHAFLSQYSEQFVLKP
ncbi:glycosyltransferase [Sphingomonas sp. RS6]